MTLIGGFYLNWRLQQALEAELSRTLRQFARTAALQIEPELLASLLPGDETTRTYRNLVAQLAAFQQASGARRLYLFDRKNRSLLDTRATPIGTELGFIPLAPTEMNALFSGQSVSSTLFSGSDGKLYKAGFAPVADGDSVVAALAVEGSAHTFGMLRTVRRDLLLLGLFLFLLAVFLGLVFSRRLTTSLNRLKDAASSIARGEYSAEINVPTRDEIGFLAKTMEDMRQAIVHRDARQKAMLAGVAHEIRNPLGGIELFAGLLVADLEDEKAREEAQKIQKEVQNLKRIVNDFLDYAKPQSARKEACEVGDIYREVLSLLAGELQGIDCRFIPAADMCAVFADPQHLRQILLNLVKNAAEALAGTGGIELNAKRGADFVELTLSDTGPGIPPDVRKRLFDPFFTTRKEGSGLGLAIAKSLIEENGGEIWLVEGASRTSFKFRLPTAEVGEKRLLAAKR